DGAKILQFDVMRTREILMQMIKNGYLEKSGVKKGIIFRLSGRLYKNLGESINYIREKGIDEIRYPELVIDYVREYKEISNKTVRELLGVNKDKASRILGKLSNSGKLIRTGIGRKDARYKINKN
ncbi:MAG: hypothetical protein ACYCSZ_14750, partial [Burkholderiales bacterium]